jgi:hypothetical protein
MAINLGRRLLTASILIFIVWTASMFPQSWYIINTGIVYMIILNICIIRNTFVDNNRVFINNGVDIRIFKYGRR